MPLPRSQPLCSLTLSFLVAACATVDKPPAPDDSVRGKAAQAQASRQAAYGARQGNAKPTPFADDAARRTVYFPFDGATIDNEGAEILRENAQKLKEDPQLVVVLVGHTDNLGSTAYNLAVADKRTEVVSDRLRALGVPRNQIRRLPIGSEQSNKLKCDSESCRRTMRRVELVYEWR